MKKTRTDLNNTNLEEFNKTLLDAFDRQNIDAFQKALKNGANPNINGSRETPLLILACNGNYHDYFALALLKNPNINVNMTNDSGDTPLIMAATTGKLTILEALLNHPKIDINRCNIQGLTALDIAKNKPSQSCYDALENADKRQPAIASLQVLDLWIREIANWLLTPELANLRLVSTWFAVVLRDTFYKRSLDSSSWQLNITRQNTFFLANGRLWGWGNNKYGQLSLGPVNWYQNTPQKVTLPNNEIPAQVVAHDGSTLCITQSGKLFAWGYNNYGQLGLGHADNQKTPQQITLPSNSLPKQLIIKNCRISCITQSGQFFEWGSNGFGQLGLGHSNDQHTPQELTLPNNEIAARLFIKGESTLCITKSFKLFAWGSNKFGQLGLGHTNDQNTPQQVTLPNNEIATQVVLYGFNACTFCITQSSKLFAWGSNKFGQLGLGHTNDQNTPQQVTLPNNEIPAQIAGDEYGWSTFCITKSGKLFVWGSNKFGELGLGPADDQSTPQQITLPNHEIAAQLVSHTQAAFCITQSGQLFVWGKNNNGWLGLGHANDQNKPQQVILPNNEIVAQVVGNGGSTFCITKSGKFFTWGNNYWGQLGLGHEINQITPQEIKVFENSLASIRLLAESPKLMIPARLFRPNNNNNNNNNNNEPTPDSTSKKGFK